MCDIMCMNCSNFLNITVYCITVYMYACNVLLTNTCNMYEIKILLLLLSLLLLLTVVYWDYLSIYTYISIYKDNVHNV